MVIAITYENGEVFPKYGPTPFFKIYEAEDGKIVSEKVVSTEGVGHLGLAGLLTDNNVDSVISGGIGPGAWKTLSELGMKLYPGVEGDADAAAAALAAGTLEYDRDFVPEAK